ncbi:cytochrome c oxidase, cbb3-type, CcoQ subunit [Campylobacter sp. faydin G-24]|uniref:Cytochrome c oxidase, cbb3-type, CcoQ subunit n=1 Tax=Campylobacter anatolicus TaxID=2829105 RepID=A0ABS5HGS7_9BACT|nr:cytochrome c oxidase, cbb3-type, CcoQ subunit [Campylobacter anatolicus]MBR8461744.1 cytochrome c oxidase, cbb3-type, CcoQ subunit [Campylobacter anatolicus]MBR8463479.1 cytochrome c oxidase, cbb3-type, CcoQ subunit [Campylobacter anatolicus]MBR8465168.1 cytochrome c oxidase, cbb3-type, CcoQ subunit [Campylobacter anatolicus]
MENLAQFQAYGYFFLTAFLVLVLYGYFFHLYKSERIGKRNYEKYSNLALNDSLTDVVIEQKK